MAPFSSTSFLFLIVRDIRKIFKLINTTTSESFNVQCESSSVKYVIVMNIMQFLTQKYVLMLNAVQFLIQKYVLMLNAVHFRVQFMVRG